MSIDTDSVQTFTDQELLNLYRAAAAAIATGQSYTVQGRSLSRANLNEVWDMIERLEKRISQATTSGTQTAVVSFGGAY